MEEFCNSSEEIAYRSEFKRSKNAVRSVLEQRPADRPVDQHAQRAQEQLGRLPGWPK